MTDNLWTIRNERGLAIGKTLVVAYEQREIPGLEKEKSSHMADKIKGVQVSATISPELDAALENHRWTVRKTRTEVVRAAVEEYAVNHKLTVAPESDADNETEESEAEDSPADAI